MKKRIFALLLSLMMIFLFIFFCEAVERTEYDRNKYVLDYLVVKIKTEYMPENNEIDVDFFKSDMVEDVELAFELADDSKYFRVHLKEPCEENLFVLKDYLESCKEIEHVDTIGFAYTDVIKYDVTLDGKTSADDARFILRCAVELEKFTDEQLKTGDTDSDNKLTAADARNVLRYSVGLPIDVEREEYLLDSLIVTVKEEYMPDSTELIPDFFESDMIKDVKFAFELPNDSKYFTVYLMEPGKENLLQLKAYLENFEKIESVDFNRYASLD